MTRRFALPGFALTLLALSATVRAAAPPPKWTQGPASVDLGTKVAKLDLPKSYAFADAKDTKRLLEQAGNPCDGSEVGLVTPASDDEKWFIVFEWHDVGYVKDDDKDKIDADKILAGIREGTEQANETRRKNGASTISVVGWDEPPHYDSATHNLVWAIRGRSSDGHEVVNYDVRLLGREGYTSATLVTDPGTLASLKPRLAGILGGFHYQQGKRYAEWLPGDKVAKYGLAALVAGGAGVAAAKLGLFAVLGKFLAKAWKLVAVAFVALGGAIKRFFSRGDREFTPR